MYLSIDAPVVLFGMEVTWEALVASAAVIAAVWSAIVSHRSNGRAKDAVAEARQANQISVQANEIAVRANELAFEALQIERERRTGEQQPKINSEYSNGVVELELVRPRDYPRATVRVEGGDSDPVISDLVTSTDDAYGAQLTKEIDLGELKQNVKRTVRVQRRAKKYGPFSLIVTCVDEAGEEWPTRIVLTVPDPPRLRFI